MGKRIKDLTTTSSPANDDYLPVDSANSGTRKISASLITGKQDAIIAGTNITIAADGKTISATDTTYSAGTNVQIDDGVISATDTTYIAGTNVQINNNIISATDTTYSAFTGATSGADGSSGLVPQPLIADKDKFLKGDGSWDTIQPGASALDDLTNVDITSPTNGQVLKYDSTNQEWVNANESGGGGGSTVTITPTLSTGTKIADYSIDGSTGALFAPNGGGGVSALSDLTDVTLTSPTNGQALVYDATNQVWINGNVSGGGGSFAETPLFTGGTSGNRTFTLSSAFTNYDYIAIYYSHNDGQTTYQDVKLYPSSLLYSLIGTSVNILGITNDAWYYYFTVTSTTQLDYAKSNAGWITDVIGIKFGSGGITATVLANTLWSSAGTYTLNDDYDNYDILEIYFCNPSVANSESDLITVMVNDVKNLMDNSKILNLTGYGDRYVNCTFSADEFTITASNSGGVQRIVGYKFNGGGGDITDLDFSDMTGSQTVDIMNKLNSGVSDSDSGTFTTGGAQYQKIEVVCGFRPTYIQVILPFSNGDTYATYDADVSTTTSTWEIPMEHNTYTITLGSETGETGITDITNTGFKFRCNAPNTRNVQCTFSARVSGQTYIQTVDFSDLTQSQIADLKTILGIE